MVCHNAHHKRTRREPLMRCAECEAELNEQDLAPYQRNQDGTVSSLCRRCLYTFVNAGFLWPYDLAQRQQGVDCE